MKKFSLLLFIAISALFGAEVNESNLDNAIKKCNAQDKIACREVSYFYDKREFRNDKEAIKLSAEYALKGCELRDGASCHTVANHYYYISWLPRYFEPDEAKQEEYYTKGCDYKYALSCHSLGLIYSMKSNDTEGSEKKIAKNKSKQFFKKACKLGYKPACNR